MKQLKYLALFFVGVFTTSCESDFLEPELTSAVNAGSYYNTAAELETAVVNMYDGLQGVNSTSANDDHSTQIEFYLTEMRSDNTRTKAQEGEAAQFEFYSVEATNGIVYDYYRSFYNVIFRANTVLANIDVVSGATAAQFEAEAKFVRAYAYFNLVRLYGAVPLITSIIGPGDTDASYTRASESDVYDLITTDLTTAVAGGLGNNRTRASQAAAQALLAKVHLTRGNYAAARTLCESIVNSGRYSLESDFEDVFYNEGNSETIFAIGYASGGVDSQNFSAEWLNGVGRTSGVNYVTLDAKNFMDANGGSRTSVSLREDSSQAGFYQVAKYLPDGQAGPDYASDPTKAGNDWIVLRYADVLLMHAESILAGGNSTSDPNAIQSFDAVRSRAGFTNNTVTLTKQALIDERRAELAFENHRLFDLMRFGVANDVLSTYSSAQGYQFTGTDLLLPIPQAEINLSKGDLSQNPGY